MAMLTPRVGDGMPDVMAPMAADGSAGENKAAPSAKMWNQYRNKEKESYMYAELVHQM